MSEFTEKLNSSELVSHAWDEIDRDQASAGLLIDTISNEFKDWQPPKPREIPVEIPQRFADWFEEKMAASFLSVVSAYSFSDDEDIKWIRDNGGLDLLCKMKLYGYTVEKEKKYILKHIDLSEQYKNESLYLSHSCYAKLKHEGYSKDVDMSKIKQCHFTQEEIDELNIGSYEQIEVKVEEVEK